MAASPQDLEEERNRQHPRERFAPDVQKLNLDELTEQIKEEPLSSPHVKQGHRQIVLSRELPQTIALYYFEPDGFLKDHRVDGICTIHVLDGLLSVEAEGKEHRLEEGDVLLLDEGVAHGVTAERESRMLLTICRAT